MTDSKNLLIDYEKLVDDFLQSGIQYFPKKRSELRNALRRAWHVGGVTSENAPSPGEGLADLVPWRFPKTTLLPKKLQLWLMIYDESVSWVCVLYACCEFKLLHKSRSSENRDLAKALLVLSARVTSDLYAIRNLVCCGLEPAARTVLRSAIEHLDTMSLLLLEPARVPDFLATGEPEDGNTFWHRNISRDKLRKAIHTHLAKLNPNVAANILVRREQRNKLYGAAVHPSKYSCDMSLFSPESMKHQEGSRIGIGYPTTISCNTLHDAAWAILELGLFFKTRVLIPDAPLHNLLNKEEDTYFLNILREGPSIFIWLLIMLSHPSLREIYFDWVGVYSTSDGI